MSHQPNQAGSGLPGTPFDATRRLIVAPAPGRPYSNRVARGFGAQSAWPGTLAMNAGHDSLAKPSNELRHLPGRAAGLLSKRCVADLVRAFPLTFLRSNADGTATSHRISFAMRRFPCSRHEYGDGRVRELRNCV